MYIVDSPGNRIGSAEFGGMLGESQPQPAAGELSPELEEFLNQVRKRPQDFRKLLLTVSLHPDPSESAIWSTQTFTFNKGTTYLIDVLVLSDVRADHLINELTEIRDDFEKRDPSFKKQMDTEWKLTCELHTTAERLNRVLLGPFIMDPLLLPKRDAKKLCKSAQDFAQKMLPQDLVRRVMNSEASEAHLTRLGRFLRSYAQELQEKDPHFEELVKIARKWEQERQERIRKQKRP